ncbi:MAG: glycoside hydrolase 5 family protein [Dehalococcoidales bacterium]
MPAFWDYENARAAGGAFDRPFFEIFQWGNIEKTRGNFDFIETDSTGKDAQAYGMHIIANIQPFAYWDQLAGYGNSQHKGKPYDIVAYANFITKLVERYDGDAIDDMPGLTVPIKHWELMNEPEFQPMYFQGTPADYVDTLKVTYAAIKQADPGAYLVQGGMASMMDVSIPFWEGVFEAGGAQYMDILNMHSIGHGEHLNIPAFKQLLAKCGLQDKPIWVTEVQYQQSRETQNYTNEDYAKTLARSYIFALANGVDKLFYVNLKMPPGHNSGIPFDERSALITNKGEKSALFKAHLTISKMLGDLDLDGGDTVEIIRERVGNWFIEEGQYKFTIHGKTIYALWGTGPLPAEITGQVRVIDITGAERTADAASLQLTSSPIFILLD